MDGTILGQGSFISGGVDQVVKIPSNADWMKVLNYTKFATAGTNARFVAVESIWQRGMAAGTGIVKYYANAGQVITGDTYTNGGFTLIDPSGNPLSAGVATTNVSNATSPVVLTGTTTGLVNGITVVRVTANAASANAAQDVLGIDFVIGAVNAGVSFTLTVAGQNALATAPGVGGAFAGTYKIVNFNPLFYPRLRYVTNITQAVNAVVSVNVPVQYVAGQLVRFAIGSRAGMIQLDGVTATVVSVAASGLNFTINVDTTTFSAFTWPTSAQMPAQLPRVNPVGEDTASALVSVQPQTPLVSNSTSAQINDSQTGILSDATVNTGFYGMNLGFEGLLTVGAAAVSGPAGATNDVVYWLAGKSTYGGL